MAMFNNVRAALDQLSDALKEEGFNLAHGEVKIKLPKDVFHELRSEASKRTVAFTDPSSLVFVTINEFELSAKE